MVCFNEIPILKITEQNRLPHHNLTNALIFELRSVLITQIGADLIKPGDKYPNVSLSADKVTKEINSKLHGLQTPVLKGEYELRGFPEILNRIISISVESISMTDEFVYKAQFDALTDLEKSKNISATCIPTVNLNKYPIDLILECRHPVIPSVSVLAFYLSYLRKAISEVN
ncbi:MAG: hypothetical protein WCK31_02990 [bacterium]